MIDEAWAWVALAMVPGFGWNGRRYHDLLRVGSPAEMFRASPRALAAAVGEEGATAIKGLDMAGTIARQRAAAERCRARLITLADPAYPGALKTIALPPPFLLVRGTLTRGDGLAVAVVGSRRPTAYGLKMAERLSFDLGTRGVTVVSGLARGIDTAAHRGALTAGGRTVAVFGCGVDVVYPPENQAVADDVLNAGALVSQFPMGTAPLAQHFPVRNRLLAALAIGTVVVEAAERSGALITARFAGELGREVYAVPGNVSSAVSRGTNSLIQDGAKLVSDWEDVVAEWPSAWRRALRPVADPVSPADAAEAGVGERGLLALLGEDPVEMDTVIERSGMPSSEVAASLMTLELRGLVRQLPGQRYVRI